MPCNNELREYTEHETEHMKISNAYTYSQIPNASVEELIG